MQTTALHIAVRKKADVSVVEALLDHKADINAVDKVYCECM